MSQHLAAATFNPFTAGARLHVSGSARGSWGENVAAVCRRMQCHLFCKNDRHAEIGRVNSLPTKISHAMCGAIARVPWPLWQIVRT
jgi:hypothetical protein